MNIKALFSSNKDNWGTPQELFDKLNDEFCFTVDLCADDLNHKVDKYYTKENDGMLAEIKGERVFCNPPYGKQIGQWVKKCSESEALSVMLLPARTDTKWFHEYIYNKAEIRFLKGRLKFTGGGTVNSAPFPSMIVIFNNKNNISKE